MQTVEAADSIVAFEVKTKKEQSPQLLEIVSGPFQALSKISQGYASLSLQGFGESILKDGNKQREAYGLAYYMSDIEAVYNAIGIGRAALFGYARAGYFAVKYAVGHPDKVSGLVLVEPALFTDRHELLERAKLAEAGDESGAMQAVLRYIDPVLGSDPAAIELEGNHCAGVLQKGAADKVLANEFFARARNPVTDRDLANLKVPVLLIGGTDSHVSDMIGKAANGIPKASVWWVRGAGILDLPGGKHASEIGSIVDLFLGTLK